LNLEARNPSPLFKRNLVRGFSCLPVFLIKFESGNQELTFPEKGCFCRILKLARLSLSLDATLAALPSISKIPFLDSRVTA
jgi:hypothetical protein